MTLVLGIATLWIGLALGAYATMRVRGRFLLQLSTEIGELDAELAAKDLELDSILLQLAELEQVIPTLEDSPAWSATTPTLVGSRPSPEDASSDLNEALVRVLHVGEKLRKCASCDAPATDSWAMEYEWGGDDVRIVINERCQSCNAEFQFKVGSQTWACMEAMRAWEGCRTARALFKSEVQNVSDLQALDGGQLDSQRTMRDVALHIADARGIPRALQFCVACERWIEPRDGSAACDCATPVIGEK